MESKTLPRSAPAKLIFEGGEHVGTVKKIALGDFAKLAAMIDELLKAGSGLAEMKEEDSARLIIEALKTAPAKVAAIVALVSSFTEEQILHADVESVVDVLLQAWHLNNLVKMFSGAIKKAMGATPTQA